MFEFKTIPGRNYSEDFDVIRLRLAQNIGVSSKANRKNKTVVLLP